MYNHFVETFIDAQTAAWRHFDAIAKTETRLFGESRNPAVRAPSVGKIVAELRHVYETVADRIIGKARDQFATKGTPPAVNRANMFRLAEFDIERSLQLGETPDFDRLWRVLEMQLGGIGSAAVQQ